MKYMVNRQFTNKVPKYEGSDRLPLPQLARQTNQFGVSLDRLRREAAANPGKIDYRPEDDSANVARALSWANWRAFNLAFEPADTDWFGLVDFIRQGHAFTAVFSGNWRSKANFVESWHIGIDFDTEDERSDLDVHIRDPFLRQNASFAYTTPSHKKTAPRSRVVFVFDEPIRDKAEFELLARALLDLYPYADASATDAARLFFGSLGAGTVLFGKTLSRAARDQVVAAYEAKRQRATVYTTEVSVQVDASAHKKYVEAAVASEAESVTSASQGSRHAALTRAGYSLGTLAGASWSGLSPDAAVQALVQAASWVTSPAGASEVERVVRDCVHAGMSSPRQAPAPTFRVFSADALMRQKGVA